MVADASDGAPAVCVAPFACALFDCDKLDSAVVVATSDAVDSSGLGALSVVSVKAFVIPETADGPGYSTAG